MHSEIQVKKNMLVELDEHMMVLVNGGDGIFQGSTKVLNSQEVICVLFNNPKCDQFTRIKIQICMNIKYILHGHRQNPYPKIFKLVQIIFTL
jgi:hypothetical protein